MNSLIKKRLNAIIGEPKQSDLPELDYPHFVVHDNSSVDFDRLAVETTIEEDEIYVYEKSVAIIARGIEIVKHQLLDKILDYIDIEDFYDAERHTNTIRASIKVERKMNNSESINQRLMTIRGEIKQPIPARKIPVVRGIQRILLNINGIIIDGMAHWSETPPELLSGVDYRDQAAYVFPIIKNFKFSFTIDPAFIPMGIGIEMMTNGVIIINEAGRRIIFNDVYTLETSSMTTDDENNMVTFHFSARNRTIETHDPVMDSYLLNKNG